MEIELKEIRDFIASIPPFDRLPQTVVDSLTENSSIRYVRRNATFPPENINQSRLYLIRKGALSHYSKDDELLEKLSEGDLCTKHCFDSDKQSKLTVDEDTLLYTVECEQLKEILKDHADVLSFLQTSASQRLKSAVNEIQYQASNSSSLMYTKVADILHPDINSISSGVSIAQAAQEMTKHNVSSLLIMQNDSLLGILTDKDFRQRCIAKGVSVEEPVDTIMSSDVLTIPSDAIAFDAFMLMTRKHIHHLPVYEGDELKGVVNITDFMRSEGKNSVYLNSAIRKSKTIEEIARHSAQIPSLQSQLVKMGATAEHLGNSVSAITTAITLRLIEMAEQKLGSAPVPYAWVAAGSQARREQTSHSDQDNGLIISDQLNNKDKKWFEDLATFVCDGLNQCGFVYCPGDVMASNPKWRQTVSVWQSYFDEWIDNPQPKALMYSSIFFDLRTIHGDKKLLKNIRKKILKKTRKNTLFLGLLIQNALQLRPPLGFFRDFVLVDDGEHNDTLNLKLNGIMPIVDLARIYALAEGVTAVNTTKRLKKTAGTASLSKEGSANLLDAFEFLGTLRIQHQAKQIDSGKTADNFMPPTEISKLEREHMKDAFKVIKTMQSSLQMRF